MQYTYIHIPFKLTNIVLGKEYATHIHTYIHVMACKLLPFHDRGSALERLPQQRRNEGQHGGIHIGNEGGLQQTVLGTKHMYVCMYVVCMY